MSITIGFAFDTPRGPDSELIHSVAAEYEDEPTIEWLRDSLSSHGEVVDIPWSEKALRTLCDTSPDVVFNITEARGGRNRESYVPALAEAMGIPCTGSDALALGVCLDKQLSKTIARSIGLEVAPGVLIRHPTDLETCSVEISELQFPLFVKPNTGGSSMGITAASRVDDPAGLPKAVEFVLDRCGDAALIEEFIAGTELAVGCLERYVPHSRPQLQPLPVAQIVTNSGGADSFYSFERKSAHDKEVRFPSGPPELLEQASAGAEKLFRTLGCRDLGRIDFRVSAEGNPIFLEINPLPGLSPFYSIFPMQARRVGIEPEGIVESLIHNACSGGAIRGQH